MKYFIAACTDAGTRKNTNQDSLTIKVANTFIGELSMVVMCDGIGGLAQGEVASGDMVRGFSMWFYHRLPELIKNSLGDYIIKSEWEHLIQCENKKISEYGKSKGISLGTTVTAGLFTDKRYYIINVGDSRAYEISNSITLITEDQTVVENEVKMGRLTRGEAENDSRRSILLQCIGASPVVNPDMFFGDTKKNTVYMFCSDGFRHMVTEDEIYAYLNPDVSVNEEVMVNNGRILIDINKQRDEKDNISVAFIRTY